VSADGSITLNSLRAFLENILVWPTVTIKASRVWLSLFSQMPESIRGLREH